MISLDFVLTSRLFRHISWIKSSVVETFIIKTNVDLFEILILTLAVRFNGYGQNKYLYK